MKQYAIIGKPVEHSLSGEWFTRYFKEKGIDAGFRMIEPEEDDMKYFRKWVLEKQFDGLLVTIPFKIDVVPYMDEIEDDARKIGAVNIIAVRDGKLCGYNTDFRAFENQMVQMRPTGFKKAIVMGLGGAAAAVVYALEKMKIPVLKVSRRKDYGDTLYSELKEQDVREADLIINTTPLGMGVYETESPPFKYQWISKNALAYDLIYNPAETLFLKKCAESGCQTLNGRGMVEFVYEQALEIWGI